MKPDWHTKVFKEKWIRKHFQNTHFHHVIIKFDVKRRCVTNKHLQVHFECYLSTSLKYDTKYHSKSAVIRTNLDFICTNISIKETLKLAVITLLLHSWTSVRKLIIQTFVVLSKTLISRRLLDSLVVKIMFSRSLISSRWYFKANNLALLWSLTEVSRWFWQAMRVFSANARQPLITRAPWITAFVMDNNRLIIIS